MLGAVMSIASLVRDKARNENLKENLDEIYTNTWYHLKMYGNLYKKLVVSKLSDTDYKFYLVGKKENERDIVDKFRFCTTNDYNDVVLLSTVDKYVIEYIGTDGKTNGWLSKHNEYIRSTDPWSEASWFEINKTDKGYEFTVKNQEKTYYFGYNGTEILR